MYKHGLRKRVAIAFAVCVALLSIVWGFAFFSGIRLSEDRVLTQQLKVAAESYPALTTNLRGYTEIDSLPKSLREWAQTNPEEGLYEFDTEELHVAVISSSDITKKAFIVFDVAGIEAESSEDWWLLLAITGVVGSLGLFGFILGLFIMRRAVAPVVELANLVSGIDPKEFSANAHKRIRSSRFGHDEVGLLAVTIEKTLERVSDFVERERNFTDAASHELRTPVTVITGAIEILEQSDLSQADKKTLARLRRATSDMKSMIEMFLCLARETDGGLYGEQFMVMPLVHKAIDQQHHLLRGKLVDVDFDEVANPCIFGHSQAFSIAVTNLVRNAFENTLDNQGPVTFIINDKELVVRNQINRNSYNSESLPDALRSNNHGLGLGIVQRLCEKNNWFFSLSASDTQVIARLSWRQDACK